MTLQEAMKTYIYIYMCIYIYSIIWINLVHPDSLLEFSGWVLVPSGNQRWQWSWFPRNPLPGGSQLTLRRWHQGDTWDAKWNWSSHDIYIYVYGFVWKWDISIRFGIESDRTSNELCSKPLLVDDYTGLDYPIYMGYYHDLWWEILSTNQYEGTARRALTNGPNDVGTHSILADPDDVQWRILQLLWTVDIEWYEINLFAK
jgi:hypothetical protein